MAEDNKEKSTSSYRQVFKATSVFGGVQAFNIGLGLIRSKLVASLIGTAGYGINSLLTTPLGLITSVTGFGISYSAIRNISQAYAEGNSESFAKTVITFRRWVGFTGLLGLLVTIVLAPYLSQSSFGNSDYTWAFVALSITILLGAISTGQGSVLYATRRIKDTSKSTMIGGVLGLITSVPLYYFYGVKGIVPALIIASCTSLLLSWYFARRVPVAKVDISYKESFREGFSFAKVGFMMMLTGLASSFAGYVITIAISHLGGVEQVGLYGAGWSITDKYVGLVFSAMAADYYPRLAGINQDNVKVASAVNQQAEIGILILGPIMLLYLLSLPILVPILYTHSFMAIIPFTQWVVLGMLLKVLGWALGFIALSKGLSGLYFRLEMVGMIFNVAAVIGGYYFFGLEGVGIAFVALYIFYATYMTVVCKRMFAFKFSSSFLKVLAILQGCCLAAFLSVKFLPNYIGYSINILIFLFSMYYSYRSLKKRLNIDVVAVIRNKF